MATPTNGAEAMRPLYRTLTDEEHAAIANIKRLGEELWNRFHALGVTRELSLAKTKLEEAVMWATKHLSG